jgi:hypothetical protein
VEKAKEAVGGAVATDPGSRSLRMARWRACGDEIAS